MNLMNLKNLKIKFLLLLIFLIIIPNFFLSGCSSSYKYHRDYEYIKNFYSFKLIPKPEEKIISNPETINELRKKVASIAIDSIGLSSFSCDSRSFLYDCSGFVFYVFYKAGIDLSVYLVDQAILGGVHQLFLIAKNYFSISQISFNIADLIIFDNTYDRNNNGKDDDLFTHVAIISEIKDDGTIVYIHKSNNGVVKGFMNLLKKDVHSINEEVINSFLKDNGNNRLSSNLFNTFATLFR
ncbi:MAG: hypothetical protein ACK4YF_07250 [Exilispira sp.]